MKLHLTLDNEFVRVARIEEISLEALMAEAAELTGRSTRELYNYRSGKLDIPSKLLPALCLRFKSFLLLDALREGCRQMRREVPDTFDLTLCVARTVREDMRHYEFLIEAFESNGVDPQELESLRKSANRVIENAYQLLSVAEEDCARRMARRDAAISNS
jgi:hypothetical protein